jgi:hypothetical protein
MKANIAQIHNSYESRDKDIAPLDRVLADLGIDKYEDAALSHTIEFLEMAEDCLNRGLSSSALELLIDAKLIVSHIVKAREISND